MPQKSADVDSRCSIQGHLWPQGYLLRGDILQEKGDYPEAAQQMKTFLAIVPDDAFAEAIRNEAERLQKLSAPRCVRAIQRPNRNSRCNKSERLHHPSLGFTFANGITDALDYVYELC